MSDSIETQMPPSPPQPPIPPQPPSEPATPPVIPAVTVPPIIQTVSPIQKPQSSPQPIPTSVAAPPQVRPAVPPPPPPPRPVVVSPAAAPVPATKPIIQHPLAATPVPSWEVTRITRLLEYYKYFLDDNCPTTTVRRKAASSFLDVVKYTLDHDTDEVLDIIWSFFVTNSDLLLINSRGLRGCESLDVQARFKVSLFFNTFRLALLGRDVGDPRVMDVALVHLRLKSNPLIRFLQQKAKIVAAKNADN